MCCELEPRAAVSRSARILFCFGASTRALYSRLAGPSFPNTRGRECTPASGWQMEARLAELDSSDYDGESPSTVSLVSRHVHQLQLDLNTLRAHVLACQRRILQREEEIVALRAQTPQSSWSAALLRPFAACFQR